MDKERKNKSTKHEPPSDDAPSGLGESALMEIFILMCWFYLIPSIYRMDEGRDVVMELASTPCQRAAAYCSSIPP